MVSSNAAPGLAIGRSQPSLEMICGSSTLVRMPGSAAQT
jgi:hypothetical protein